MDSLVQKIKSLVTARSGGGVFVIRFPSLFKFYENFLISKMSRVSAPVPWELIDTAGKLKGVNRKCEKAAVDHRTSPCHGIGASPRCNTNKNDLGRGGIYAERIPAAAIYRLPDEELWIQSRDYVARCRKTFPNKVGARRRGRWLTIARFCIAALSELFVTPGLREMPRRRGEGTCHFAATSEKRPGSSAPPPPR